MTLPQQVKEYLNTATPKGAYLEAFVYARAVTDTKDSAPETHSIPVLGFYGGWTESSMYDVGTYMQKYSAAASLWLITLSPAYQVLRKLKDAGQLSLEGKGAGAGYRTIQ